MRDGNNRYKYGITFNGKHSTDFGLDVLDEKEFELPEKEKILVDLPHSNLVYDFSEVYGDQNYSERTITFPFLNIDREEMTKEALYRLWTKVVNWLMQPTTKTKLIDDVMLDYYYLAEVQEAPTFEEAVRFGTLTVKFQCYPFRISESLESNDNWDEFDLEDGFAQTTSYTIDGFRVLKYVNAGIGVVTPTVTARGNFTIQKDGQTFKIYSGTGTSDALVLKNGENILYVTGTGTLTIDFRKEII